DLQCFVPGGYWTLQHDEGTHRLAGELIGPADDRRLGDETRVRHERRLDLHRAEPVARHVQYVIDATDDAEIPLLVRTRTVTGEIELLAELLRPIGLEVPIRITPDGFQHGG